MYELNEKIRDLKPYDPIDGNYKIRLDANESCFNLPDYVLKRVHEAIDKIDFNRYPDPMAKRVNKAFADYYGIDDGCVTAGNGSDELISIIMTAFLMKGDRAVTVSPDFSMYSFYASLCEAECVKFEKNKDLTIDVDSLINTVNKTGARMVIFSNPCNPTSKGITRDEARRLINGVNALVVLDEAYMDFWEHSLLDEAQSYDNLIILRTASKAVGAAAIRLGFAVANRTLTNVLRAVKSPYNVNTLTQETGRIIFESRDWLEEAKSRLLTYRAELYNNLKNLEEAYPDKLEVIEGCSNFVFIKTPLAKEIYQFLLDKSIAVRYMGEFLRIAAGSAEENRELSDRLSEFFKTE